jgi:hypothetical protein
VQLDKTRLAIRERGMIDTYDLTLHVLRQFGPRLIPALLLGIVPLALVDHFLLWSMIAPTSNVSYDGPEDFFRVIFDRYTWQYLVQVFYQAPIATIFAEAYLGGAVFNHEKSWGEIFREVFAVWQRPSPRGPRQVGPLVALVLCQGLLRGTLIALALPLLAWGDEINYGYEVVIPILMFFPVALLRSVRPYINEIIVLEKNPLWSRTAPMTVGRRSANLHNASWGELLGQWLGACLVAIVLFQMVFWSLWLVYMIMFGDTDVAGWVPQMVLRPIALWSVVAFLGVARFLSYLDLRIRQEGWEVELLVRAEAARLAENLV